MSISEAPGGGVGSTEQFAQKIFSELHRLIIAQEKKSVDGDVDAVHDMRVAIRRLRVALGNFAFCLPAEDRRRLRTRLEHLADALGGVRDLDVLIARLELTAETRPSTDRPAINSIIRRLKARRRRKHRQLVDYLRREEYADFKREFSFAGKENESQTFQISEQKERGQAA